MTPINIEKRCKEETESIRNRVLKSKNMTIGEKNGILNRISALNRWAEKVAKQQRTPHYRHANYDARTNDDIAAQARAKKAVFMALMAGRHVDLTCSEEFQLSQFHTAISQIRRDIVRKHPNLELCDEWVRKGDGSRPYKSYWLEKKEDSHEQH